MISTTSTQATAIRMATLVSDAMNMAAILANDPSLQTVNRSDE